MKTQIIEPLKQIIIDAQSAANQTGRKMIVFFNPNGGFFNFTNDDLFGNKSKEMIELYSVFPECETPPGMNPQFCKFCEIFTQPANLIWTQFGAVCSSECYDAIKQKHSAELPSDHCRTCNRPMTFDLTFCPDCGTKNGEKSAKKAYRRENNV